MEFWKSTGSDRWVISPWYAAAFTSERGPAGNLMVDSCAPANPIKRRRDCGVAFPTEKKNAKD
jgi:hypothetical protein